MAMSKYLSAFLGAVISTQAQAQTLESPAVGYLPLYKCGPTNVVTEMLKKEYKLSVAFIGAASPKHADQLYINPNKGEYVILRNNIERGVSCVVAEGFGGKLYDLTNVIGEPT